MRTIWFNVAFIETAPSDRYHQKWCVIKHKFDPDFASELYAHSELWDGPFESKELAEKARDMAENATCQ